MERSSSNNPGESPSLQNHVLATGTADYNNTGSNDDDVTLT